MRSPEIIRTSEGQVLVKRFSLPRRFEHVLAIVTFVALIVTGFPQKFDTSTFGHWILGVFGGLENARWVHRAFGVVFTLHALTHIAMALLGAFAGRMRLTLLPVTQDLRDAWQNLRYYTGYRPTAPELPKFDYRQKFEYIGLVLGGLVMVFSGLVLMYPMILATWLPAALIPAMQVAHSSEAMLAFLVLVVWHVYGAVLSPEVFPIDRSIITGYMPAEELEHHHAREYKRLFPHGHGARHGSHGHTPVAMKAIENAGSPPNVLHERQPL